MHVVDLDKRRPAVIMTRAWAVPTMTSLLIAPVTSRIGGLDSEVSVDGRNGLDHESVISCDNMQVVDKRRVREQVGELTDEQELELQWAVWHTCGFG